MTRLKTRDENWRKWEVADELRTDEDCADYLNAVIDLDDPLLLQAALGDIAKARGMTAVSEQSGLSRENLYRVLSGTRDAYFSTIAKVLDSLGLTMRIEPKNT